MVSTDSNQEGGMQSQRGDSTGMHREVTLKPTHGHLKHVALYFVPFDDGSEAEEASSNAKPDIIKNTG